MKNPSVTATYRVMSAPTLILFRGGRPILTVVGARSEAKLLSELDHALASAPRNPESW
ncbi:thioredoxin family protein [Nocardia sp. NPDC059091]|uniref:thioredoxin family protein n=1 Tax=unclassified Nocardia TaxID=2637762 RepID=UPI003691E6A5